MAKNTLILTVLFAALFSPLSAQQPAAKAIDPAKASLIEEMLRLTKPESMLQQALVQYKSAFSNGMEKAFNAEMAKNQEDPAKYQTDIHRFEDQMFALISDRMSWEKMKPKFMGVYDETFSKEELSDVVAFYKTPSGQSLLQKMPMLMQKAGQIGQAQMGDVSAEVGRMAQEFMANLKKQHDAAAGGDKK
jgi:hypothetical protein